MNYQEASAWLDRAKKRDAGKPINNNTRIFERENGNIAIQLHSTDIITFQINGDCILDSGGWFTSTTKGRMNEYMPFGYIIQHNGQWYIQTNGKWQLDGSYIYSDGIILKADGTIDAPKYSKATNKAINAKKRRINKYVKGFMEALNNKQIPQPSGGDCWYCCLKEVKTGKPLGTLTESDHITSHIQEKYYVPSLLINAVERFPVSEIARAQLGYLLGYHDQDCTSFAPMHQIESSLKRYIQEQFGMAS